MGMNYYYVATDDDVLRVLDDDIVWQDKIHIGKSAYGWEFSFHACSKEDLTDAYRGIVEISSFKEWRKVFKKVSGIIINEEDIRVSVKDFINIVRHTKTYEQVDYKNGKMVKLGKMKSRSHYQVHYQDDPYCFLDPEGWTFVRQEFS